MLGKSEEPEIIFKQLNTRIKHWNNFHGLGRVLMKLGKYNEALKVFKRMVYADNFYYEDVCCAYGSLRNLEKVKESEKSQKTWYKQIKAFNPIISSRKGDLKRVVVSKSDLKYVVNTFKEEQVEFFPSIKLRSKSELNKWNKLFFLHISKCSGTTFASPIYQMKQYIGKHGLQAVEGEEIENYLNTSRHIYRREEIPCLKQIIEEYQGKSFDNIFYTTHGASWTSTYETLKELYDINATVLAITRDPSERLFSHILHEASLGYPIEHFQGELEKVNSYYDNTIYKYLYDYNLESYPSDKENIELNQDLERLDVVDIKDNSTKWNIKTSILSSSKLPNMLQMERLNEAIRNANGSARYGKNL